MCQKFRHANTFILKVLVINIRDFRFLMHGFYYIARNPASALFAPAILSSNCG